ncbi:MAG TPA: efflux RND transporter periplasmic adaptor subunit [Steroidobacteraceae bacterium]|jgi:RND family efflux transporter MFP subunit|nr:efflux RND transporter periplasmic adaptor subunit [Steroidobacteraceae bacterium]
MDEKSALLDQLRIDRREPQPASGKGLKIGLAAGAALVVIAAATVWWWNRGAGIPVHVVTAERVGGAESTAGSILDASGYIVARRQATVASKITAKMVELDIEEGDHVKEGQVIAKLDDTNVHAALNEASAQLEFAKASLAETRVNLANAKRDYDRQTSLLQNHYVSQSTVDNAQTAFDALKAQLATQESNVGVVSRALAVAQRNEDDTVVRAPFSGIVTVKAAQPGEMVSPVSAGGGFTRTGIGTIVDMDSLEIQVDVNENFINRVRPDGRATAKLNAYPDWQIPAHVIAVIPTADRSKGTVTVRLALDQKDARILPEMGVRVSFLADAGPASGPTAAGVTLPAKAVQASGSTGTVFVVREDTVERRAVRMGAGSGDAVTILSGISPGERVVIGDFNQLKDGAKIRIEQ